MSVEIKERVDKIESVLGQFIVHTDTIMTRLEKRMEKWGKESVEREKRLDSRMEKWSKESVEREKRLDSRMEKWNEETVKERKKMTKQWGELANKWGTVIEDIVVPNIPEIAKNYFGCGEFDDFMIRRKKKNSKDKSQIREFDVIAVYEDRVILNETKSTPRMSYIDDFIDFLNKKEFYDYFPEYKNKKLIPIFASLYLSNDIVNYLSKNNIYAMALKVDIMDILNPDLKRKTGKSKKK